MKQKFIYIIISIFLLGLIFPNHGFVQVAGISNSNQAQTISSQLLVKVITVHFASQVVVADQNQKPAISSSCQLASSINLNEPANCFSLEINRQITTQPKIVVINSPSTAKVSVVISHPVLSFSDFSKAPAIQQIPVLPLAAFVFFIVYELSDKKIFVKSGKLLNQSNLVSLNLAQLQVMRC